MPQFSGEYDPWALVLNLIFIESEYSYLLKLFQTTMLIVLAIRYLISGLLDTNKKQKDTLSTSCFGWHQTLLI